LITAVIQCFPEGKNVSETLALYIRDVVGMSQDAMSIFYSGFGTIMVFGGRLAGPFQKALGLKNFTTFCNVLTLAGFGLWGTGGKLWAMWLGLAILMPSMERRSATSAAATDHAVVAGMGRGEYQASFANFRALATAFAPWMYGKIYTWSQSEGRSQPGLAFWAMGGFAMIAEVVNQTISSREYDAAFTEADEVFKQAIKSRNRDPLEAEFEAAEESHGLEATISLYNILKYMKTDTEEKKKIAPMRGGRWEVMFEEFEKKERQDVQLDHEAWAKVYLDATKK